LGPPLKHFLEKFPLASARIIAMHFNVSHSAVKDIYRENLDCENSPEDEHRISYPTIRKKNRVNTSAELLALLDQYSELQFDGIATGDES
jgi:hypothetical protein